MAKKENGVKEDLLGQELAVGDVVAYSHRNLLYVGVVGSIHNVQIRVKRSIHATEESGLLKYPSQVAKISTEQAMMYILLRT